MAADTVIGPPMAVAFIFTITFLNEEMAGNACIKICLLYVVPFWVKFCAVWIQKIEYISFCHLVTYLLVTV